jgi:crotonobetainyl-CoA:carnitine CoA-transferase CaiB-like acyl-CoA transferase
MSDGKERQAAGKRTTIARAGVTDRLHFAPRIFQATHTDGTPMKLEGIRVLDLSNFLPGPHLTMMMADHGAEVIRIEPPGGEPNRAIGKKYPDGTTVYFSSTHRNKKSVMLDFKKPGAVEAFLKLAATADVVLESFRPGVVDRLGIGYAAVRAVNPRIVYCSIAAYGQTGPYAKRVAHDASVQAECGLMDLNRGTDGAPVMPAVPAADMAASLMALSGILMALLRRATTGEGDFVDIGMHDSLTAWMANIVGPAFTEDREMDPKEERTFGGYAFYNVYRCADGKYLTMGGSEIKFASNILTALGRPDLIDICKEPPGPVHDPVKAFLTETFASKPLAHWQQMLDGIDCCWAPVKGVREGLMSEQVKARELKVGFPDGTTHLGIPIKFGAEPGRILPKAPALGEHTDAVLMQAGLGAEEIGTLRAAGAIR